MVNTGTEAMGLLDQLKLPERELREAVMARLETAGRAGIELAIQGLAHPHWRVRRNCCRFFDDHFDARAVDGLIGCLTDRNRKVRQQALHALSCDACKPGEGPIGYDITGYVIERLRNDPSVRVRRYASITLIQLADEVRVREALWSALSDPDPIVRRNAGWGLGNDVDYSRLGSSS